MSLEKYTTYMDEVFSIIVKEYNRLQLSEYSIKTIENGKSLMTQGSNLLHILKTHVNSIETLLADCQNFVDEVEDDLSEPAPQDGFVFHTKNNMLSYLGKEFIEKQKKQIVATSTSTSSTSTSSTSTSSTSTTSNAVGKSEPLTSTQTSFPSFPYEQTTIPEIGYKLPIHVVQDLKQIPPAMYYYKAPKGSPYQSGIYMRLSGNNLVRIPTPEVIDSKKEYDRKHSIRCKYKNKQECDEQRKKMAKMYNSTVRICNFAHDGDRLVKIGYPSRCPSIPSFGNPATMAADITSVHTSDIKNTLMYGLSDVLAASIWLDYNHFTGGIYERLDQV
jgi:hypothetical protein